MQSIQAGLRSLHTTLRDYIEATYHIRAPSLVARRKVLLDEPGVIFQNPYLESTPRYRTGKPFASMPGLPPAALAAYEVLAREQDGAPRLVFDPPYQHQFEAVQQCLVGGKNLVIMTGTGSGKTEAFLLPILGGLPVRRRLIPPSFDQPAMRALILYPMNALVNDQLAGSAVCLATGASSTSSENGARVRRGSPGTRVEPLTRGCELPTRTPPS